MAGRKLLKRENISPIHIPLAEEEEEGKKKNNNNRIRENTPADSLWLFSFRHPFKKKANGTALCYKHRPVSSGLFRTLKNRERKKNFCMTNEDCCRIFGCDGDCLAAAAAALFRWSVDRCR